MEARPGVCTPYAVRLTGVVTFNATGASDLNVAFTPLSLQIGRPAAGEELEN
ncbi:hypothetical protein PENSUB_5985 [Penicillium subrubescens]|uniref:Uncharacterized protein n=1 Tax=Penicillium subrubescens TaxID=1316194 RepID=A0A1Q5U4J6_9EURO|nr:hypothetical protein PENSUB_5985 [Penicillium subrubescens]